MLALIVSGFVYMLFVWLPILTRTLLCNVTGQINVIIIIIIIMVEKYFENQEKSIV